MIGTSGTPGTAPADIGAISTAMVAEPGSIPGSAASQLVVPTGAPPIGPFHPGAGDGSPASVLVGSESWRGRLNRVEKWIETQLMVFVSKMDAWYSEIQNWRNETNQRIGTIQNEVAGHESKFLKIHSVVEGLTAQNRAEVENLANKSRESIVQLGSQTREEPNNFQSGLVS